MPDHPYYKSQHWTKLRQTVLRRDKWTCCDCGAKALGKKRNGISPVVDHVTPRPNSPMPTMLDVPANLITRCHPCHSKKTKWVDQSTKPEIGLDGLPVDGAWGG